MNESKGLLTRLAETIDQYRAEQRALKPKAGVVSVKPPGRMGRLLHWFLPNGGMLIVIALLIAAQSVWARSLQAPAAPGPSATTVNYQGRLANNGGAPLSGNYAMTFAIYDAASGGNLIWGPETHAAIPVSNGLFSAGLGSQTSGGIPTTAWNGDRYLEISVGGETLSPRELIRSVPIAGMALTVPDGSITSAKIVAGAIKSRHFAPSRYEDFSPALISTTGATAIATGVSVTFNCETNCVAQVLHRGLIMHSVANGRVDVFVVVDGNTAFNELGYASARYNSVSGFGFVNLLAGAHTVEVKFACSAETPGGTCTYYGGNAGIWEHLNVMVFAQ